MKRIILFFSFALIVLAFSSVKCFGQDDKSKRPSPAATVKQTLKSGATVTINYSQPAVKGRVIGKDVEPMKGRTWRMGANEATVFEVDKDVSIEGRKLPAGKYSLWGVMGDKDFTLIFNKAWDIWGTMYDQNKDKDVLKVNVKTESAANSSERLTYKIDPSGKVTLAWGKLVVPFMVH